MIRVALAIAIAAPATAWAQQAPASVDLEVYATPQTVARLPDGRRLNFYCAGTGPVTVILEGGWTASSASWRKVQPELAKHSRVCSYDRAGYGFSDPGPLPRDADAIVADLRAGLKAAGIKPPYLIVGHSLGGMLARHFAAKAGRDVVGMVLVDPAAEYQGRRTARLVPASGKADAEFIEAVKTCATAIIERRAPVDGPCVSPASKSLPASVNAARLTLQNTPGYQRSALSELLSMESATSDEVAASRKRYPNLPLIVLTADQTAINPDLSPADQKAATKIWWDMHAE
ncbi:MAG: alpha/beta fold hydrolase, partial [Sphingomonadales bacterium]